MKRMMISALAAMLMIQSGCAAAEVKLNTAGAPKLMTPAPKPAGAPDALWYQVKGNGVVGVTENLIVRVKDAALIDTLAGQYGLTVKSKLMENVYLLSGTDRKRTIELCNTLGALPGVVYAEPDFLQKMEVE